MKGALIGKDGSRYNYKAGIREPVYGKNFYKRNFNTGDFLLL